MRASFYALGSSGLAAFTFTFAACDLGPIVVGYRTMSVDPVTLHVGVEDPVIAEVDDAGKVKAVLGSYYQVFVGQGGGTSVDHYFQRDAESPRVRYNHFEMGPDRILARRVRSRELLRGPFGTVYSRTECFFNTPVPGYSNFVEVSLYSNQYEREPAVVALERVPGPADTLRYLSVVRVLRGSPEYVVAAATYSPTGQIQRLTIDGSRDGDWVHSNYVPEARNGFIAGSSGVSPEDRATLQRYGLPVALPADDVGKESFRLGLASAGTVVLDAIHSHYEYDNWVRQEQIEPGGARTVRYLIYAQMAEDAVLNSRCVPVFRQEAPALQRKN